MSKASDYELLFFTCLFTFLGSTQLIFHRRIAAEKARDLNRYFYEPFSGRPASWLGTPDHEWFIRIHGALFSAAGIFTALVLFSRLLAD